VVRKTPIYPVALANKRVFTFSELFPDVIKTTPLKGMFPPIQRMPKTTIRELPRIFQQIGIVAVQDGIKGATKVRKNIKLATAGSFTFKGIPIASKSTKLGRRIGLGFLLFDLIDTGFGIREGQKAEQHVAEQGQREGRFNTTVLSFVVSGLVYGADRFVLGLIPNKPRNQFIAKFRTPDSKADSRRSVREKFSPF